MDEAWADSKFGMDDAHEEGGFIYKTYYSGEPSIQVIRVASGTYDRLPALSGPLPSNARGELVGTFHTHPQRGTGFRLKMYTRNKPSSSDKRHSKFLGVPGIIRPEGKPVPYGTNKRAC